MINWYKDETQWHFAQKYYEKAQQLEIIKWVDITPSNFDTDITRWDVAILVYNAFNVPWVKISNKDLQYIESEVVRINNLFKPDSIERWQYIDKNFYQKEEEIWSKEEKISSSILFKLEENTKIVYLDRFTCKILDIQSMIWWELDSNTQIIGINIDCKNTSKTWSKIDFIFAIRDLSSKQDSTYTYINTDSVKNKSWFKFINFYWNDNIKSPSIDPTNVIEPWKSIDWRVLANIPKNISTIRYILADWKSLWGIVTTLENPNNLSERNFMDKCQEIFSFMDCYSISLGRVYDGMSEQAFKILNDGLIEIWDPYFKLKMTDSYSGDYYCIETESEQTCIRISDWEISNKNTIYFN